MPADIKEVFRRVLDELETEERNELLLQLENKKLTGKELIEAIRDLPDNERAEIREALIAEAQTGDRESKKVATELDKDAQKDEEARGIEGEEPPPEETSKKNGGKKRPGRKHGRAYGWYVDEKGRVQVSDVATVYSGEDEPDEVELYPDEENEEEEVEE